MEIICTHKPRNQLRNVSNKIRRSTYTLSYRTHPPTTRHSIPRNITALARLLYKRQK